MTTDTQELVRVGFRGILSAEPDLRTTPAARQQPAALAGLTRELDVMRLLAARGMSNTDIARELVLGDAIVKTHVARIFTNGWRQDRRRRTSQADPARLAESKHRRVPVKDPLSGWNNTQNGTTNAGSPSSPPALTMSVPRSAWPASAGASRSLRC